MISLLLSRWRVIAPIIFMFVLLCYVFYLKTRYDAIVSELAIFKQNIAQQAALQQVKNEILRKQAEKQVKDLTEIHTHNLEAVKHEYEKAHNLDSITIGDLRERLLSELRSTYTMPTFDTNTERTPSEWQNSYTTIARQYQTLKDACTITTLDYNALRGWSDAACDQVGCE
jgi:hypothetical protein